MIATTSHDGNYLALYTLNADRTVTLAAQDGRVGFHPDWVHAVNSDAIYVCAEDSHLVQRWKYGPAGLELSQSIRTEGAPMGLAVGDLDKDGQLELVAAPYAGNFLEIIWPALNAGYSIDKLKTGTTPLHPLILDWNGDGKNDILWSEYHSGDIKAALGQDKRNFSIHTLHNTGSKIRPRQMAAGDVNGDSHPDLIVPLELGKGVRILLNQLDTVPHTIDLRPGNIGRNQGYYAAAYSRIDDRPTIAMSENGRIVLARPSTADQVDGGWEYRELAAEDQPMDLQFSDLDGDGQTDLMFANMAGNSVQIYFGPLWKNASPLR